jgi:uroporphyrinogen decarboxylase
MTGRERALAVFSYQENDRPCFDLMEGYKWHELGCYFNLNYGCKTNEDVLTLLDCDFRWSHMFGIDDKLKTEDREWQIRSSYSDALGGYLLADAHTSAEVDKLFHPDASQRPIPDFRSMRETFPDKALVFCIPWTPIFSGACSVFGIQEAMIKMLVEPEVFKAFAIKQSEYLVEYLRLAIKAGAAQYCDFFWTGDDFASESCLLLSPQLWRELIRPYLEPAIRLAKDSGFHTLFHSCGAVSDVYSDFIDMGIDAHIGVQTSARGMNIDSLARNYGGKIVVFGGVDAQTTLVQCTPEEVVEQVQKNIKAFEHCGGYIVSNAHHTLPDIKGKNIVAMARGACRYIPLR